MFTEETENRIASFFNELANTLTESLTARSAVKDSVTYHPPTIFTYLSNHKDFVNINDIIDYLKCNCIYATRDEIAFMLFLSGCVNDKVSQVDFCIGMFNDDLTHLNSKNEDHLFKIKDRMLFETLIKKKLEIVRVIEFYSLKITKRNDFSMNDMFMLLGRNTNTFNQKE